MSWKASARSPARRWRRPERIERVDQALARQLSRSMQLNAQLQLRIKELEGRNA
ncbi:hypothetical protein BRDID11004_60490 [Bradyrhizobium diazoefficiens]|uniref:Uncharacterized protein n=1 Tax=Bradyrhizobium diazoefficiens TaxID=1355477 RepID=A0A809ZRX0_9BRAD|nr:hypothetical protein [Bradyrhizobium diazoefficiens]BBZ93053.1 hypothetical protein F07S3_28860 [Bradyrhizobium diazoefficiens]BCA10803.1 hypothetical protein BDHF08_26500 [Bradyrhizobium diazoefficiens]BCE55139.1 hypothetical protein XF5B_26510 [Bradyrhizobium diazoefficiens]BCE63872.1 hypothetical protein XF6B_26710 [Bradyrhizobium diazoefficiens]